MSRILVTDGELRASLAAVRSLGARHAVDVMAASERSLAGVSRFARTTARCPDPLRDPAGFRACLGERVAQQAIDVVLPVSDAACRALLESPAGLGKARLAAPDAKAYTRLSHKGYVARMARDVGLRIPEGGEAHTFDDALALARTLGWPVIVKPVLSVDAGTNAGLRKRGVARAADERELRQLWETSVAPAAALIQTIVPGSGEGIFLLRWDGVTRAAFAHRRVREKPPSGGVSVLCESIAVDPVLRGQVERILDGCAFSGVAMCELRRDGEMRWLMEFNARLWGSLQLALDAGVDFPGLLIDAVMGESARPIPAYRAGLRSRWLFGDLDHALALARGAAGADGRTGIGAALSVLLRSAGRNVRWENPRRGDLRPFWREAGDWISALRKSPAA